MEIHIKENMGRCDGLNSARVCGDASVLTVCHLCYQFQWIPRMLDSV